jgi:flagellar biosynthesis protein FlhG
MAKQIIAVGGGKGGVGKSIIAANLAIAIAQSGVRTTLVDADLGGANLHTMFGIDRPKGLLEHFISGKIEKLDEILIPSPQERLCLVCGGMPVLGTANPKFTQKARLIRHIKQIPSEVVVLDIGAGVGFNALDLFNAAEYKLIAFVPQLTSLHNGYGFLKSAVHRLLERLISESVRDCLQSSTPESGQESLRQVIARIAAEDTGEADKARVILNEQRVFLVGNMVKSDRDKHVVSALKHMIKDHLIIDSEVLGILKFGDKIERSVNERRPFMMSAGIESNAEVFRFMAERLLSMHRSAEGRRISKTVIVAEDSSPRPVRPSQFDRKEPRYPTSRIHAELKGLNGDVYTGHLLNIAHGGALMVFADRLPMPAEGILVIGPSPSGIIVEARVQERHRNRKDQRVGFAFSSTVDSKTQERIADLVAEAAAQVAVSRVSEL